MRRNLKVRNVVLSFLLATAAVSLIACGGGGGSDSDESQTSVAKVDMEATFTATSKPISIYANLMNTNTEACPSPAPSTDSSGTTAGLDCDGDGGVVRYVTPEGFKIGIKSLTFIKDDGVRVEIISDTGSLVNSEVHDLTSVTVNLFEDSIPAGTYPTVEAEFYYYEVNMQINDSSTYKNVRIYLSDDNFPDEDNLGHHQGDITFIDDNATELGWVPCALEWKDGNLQADRTGIEGAGGTDTETGHKRGLYGDADLWNNDSFDQGDGQDIYILTRPLDLTIENQNKTVTISFDLNETWFYEDFNDNEIFDPCPTEACSDDAEWSPIFPDIDISIE